MLNEAFKQENQRKHGFSQRQILPLYKIDGENRTREMSSIFNFNLITIYTKRTSIESGLPKLIGN